MEFEEFPKIGRLRQQCTITEKIDGTNAQICFNDSGEMLVGSRKREIFPESTAGQPKGCDNFAFARWADNYHVSLFEFLGEGRHYGEWAGLGIQRNYGLTEKRFYLFNSFRLTTNLQPINIPECLIEAGLRVVPVLYQGDFSMQAVSEIMNNLKINGSFISPFDNPEGIIVYHHGTHTYSKVTFEYDKGKWSREK